jgi:hypothetical protein
MRASRQSQFAAVDDDYFDDHLVGERIGPPRARTGRKIALWSLVLLVLGLGGMWSTLGPPENWPVRAWTEWAMARATDVAAVFDRKATTSERATTPERMPELAKPLPVDNLPPTTSLPPQSVATINATTPPETTVTPEPQDKGQVEPLPPPAVDRNDPYQVRAEAVGLHPGLSRALLSRLSDADYRNAGIAIQKALRETPDDATLVWPQQRKPELALFKVHFVLGAASDCRRYVVTVTKDRWMTTALPMERCGAQVRHAQRK